jgi:hypothetical protein
MFKNIFIALLILVSFSCQTQQAQISDNTVENKIDSMSNLLVNSNIGVPHKNKIEIFNSEKSDGNVIEIKFYSLIENKKWKLKQTFEFEIYNSVRFDPKFEDFNNDGLKDFTYQSSYAGRGANDIRRLFIYDRKNDELVYITNSEEYPNLLYNKHLDCLDAQRFYGGTAATNFLKIDENRLIEFASVVTLGNERKVYLVDKNGQEKLLRTDKVVDDVLFQRYKTFNPPIAYRAEELEQ